MGVLAVANALLIIPKTLAINSGHDAQDVIVKLVEAYNALDGTGETAVGLDLVSGEASTLQVEIIYFIPTSFLNEKFPNFLGYLG